MQIETKRLVIRDIKTNDAVPFAIMTADGTLNDGAEVVGSVGCSYYEDLRETRITYFVGVQYRNNGYAVEVVKAYTEYFLKCYNAKRIIATVRNENVPSWKVIEKAGYILLEIIQSQSEFIYFP